MDQITEKQNLALPFLIPYASERTSSEEISGRYCYKKFLWLVDNANSEIPLIKSKNHLLDAETHTRNSSESNDASEMSGLLDLETSTRSVREQNDCLSSLQLELETKSQAMQEQDDVTTNDVKMFF